MGPHHLGCLQRLRQPFRRTLSLPRPGPPPILCPLFPSSILAITRLSCEYAVPHLSSALGLCRADLPLDEDDAKRHRRDYLRGEADLRCVVRETNSGRQLRPKQLPVFPLRLGPGGTGAVDLKRFDETGYILQPPCIWGSVRSPMPAYHTHNHSRTHAHIHATAHAQLQIERPPPRERGEGGSRSLARSHSQGPLVMPLGAAWQPFFLRLLHVPSPRTASSCRKT